MFIFPTGHAQSLVRRWPWVTTAILVLNVVIYFVCTPFEASAKREAVGALSEAVSYLSEHPYLTPPPLVEAILPLKDRSQLQAARSNEKFVARATRAIGRAGIEREQAALDVLGRRFHDAMLRAPSFGFGYRPSDRNWLGLLTSQFLHAGILHLLGNMWFLWLVGCNIEDGWGRLLFPAFYLSAGAIGALSHKLGDPSSVVPLIGASGAVAGAMGAFLVRFATTKIRFFALLLWHPVRFSAPAYLMLPLWFAAQVGSGLWQSEGGKGVAYFAHVGGFAYGVIIAVLVRISGIEKRLDASIENRDAFSEDPAVAEAARYTDTGKYGAAIVKLEAVLAKEPRRMDALLELLRASAGAGDAGRESRTKIKLIELYLQAGAPQSAMALYAELGGAVQRTTVPPSLRMRIARQYDKMGIADRAWVTFQELHAQKDDRSIALAALVAHADLATRLGRRSDALLLWQRAEAHGDPDLTNVVREGMARATALVD